MTAHRKHSQAFMNQQFLNIYHFIINKSVRQSVLCKFYVNNQYNPIESAHTKTGYHARQYRAISVRCCLHSTHLGTCEIEISQVNQSWVGLKSSSRLQSCWLKRFKPPKTHNK